MSSPIPDGPAPSASAPLTLVGTLSEGAIAQALGPFLAGTPIAPNGKGAALPSVVVWSDFGDELALHLDSTRVLLRDNMLYVSVDTETDQLGRSTIAMALAIASTEGALGLTAVTEATPRGDPRLIARWGSAVERAVWQGFVSVVMRHAPNVPSDSIVLRVHPGALAIHSADAGNK